MKKGYHHLSYADRIQFEALIKAKTHYRDIARLLGYSLTTVYNEYKRGLCTLMDSDLRRYSTYSADVAQMQHDYNATNKGQPPKLANDFAFLNYVESKMVDEKYSPAAVLADIQRKRIPFRITVCVKTLYNYINSNMFFSLTNNKLLQNPRIKRDYNKVHRRRVKIPLCRSIEERPVSRNEFGHWEMDTVVGKAKGKGQALLVLTERKSRYEIIRKMQRHTQAETCRILDSLEKEYKGLFSQVFKTIAVDNGSEFLSADSIERSCFADGKRTTLYYCHPYSSCERGSNENANRIIRRFIPKSTPLENYTPQEVQSIEAWMNNYPRQILGRKCANDVFQEELLSL